MRATPLAAHLAIMTLCLQTLRLAVRMACCARVYGFIFALGVPVRAVYANVLNSTATFLAIARYAESRVRGLPLTWVKTEHAFPHRAALLAHKRKLGEILVGSGYVSAEALKIALADTPDGVRLGDYLVRAGQLDVARLYEALSLQQGLAVVDPNAREVPRWIARALPEHVARRWRVVPFRVEEGRLWVAGPDAPPVEMNESLRTFTALEIRFCLITPARFEVLVKALF
jgi:hypothetical protein